MVVDVSRDVVQECMKGFLGMDIWAVREYGGCVRVE
jgi:hypothetical protein